MKKYRVLSALLCAVAVIVVTTCFASAETISNYDAKATLDYAKAHCEDDTEPGATKADCTEFVRTCVQNGGVPQDKARVFKDGTGYTVEDFVNYMIDYGYAELKELKFRTHTDYYGKQYRYVHQDDNEGLVAPGDIIIYKCGNSKCEKEYLHASICAPADTEGTYEGYYRYYAHNTSVNNKILCSIKCSKCKKEEKIYALHITSQDNGYDAYTKTTAAKVKCTAYNKLKVSWDKVKDAEGYNVFFKSSSKAFWEKIAAVEGASYTYKVPKNYYGATQYFKVIPYTAIDGKTHVGKSSKTVSGYTVPAAPKKVTLKLTDYRSVKVSWPKVSGATVYKVEYKPQGSSKWSFLYRGSKLSATKKNLTVGKKYTFRVTTFTSSKAYQGERASKKYTSATIYTLKTLAKPTVKRVNKKTVKVTWKAIEGADGYQISKAAKKGKVGTIKTVKGKKIKSAKVAAQKGKKFYYKVRAYKTVGNKKVVGPWSAVKYL